MTKVDLGVHLLGHEGVRVFLDSKMLGATCCMPGNWSHRGLLLEGEMVLGVAHKDWAVVLENLMHEALEYVLGKMGCRLTAYTVGCDSSYCTFVANHSQFAEAVVQVAEFIAPLERAIREGHRRAHSKRSKRNAS